jgi:hypothetical protein
VIACEQTTQTFGCDPRGVWLLAHEQLLPSRTGPEQSHCPDTPSEWRLEIEELPGGALQLLFGRGDENTTVELEDVFLRADGCHVDLNVEWNRQIGDECTRTVLDLALDFDRATLTGSAVASFGSLDCAGKTTVSVTGTRAVSESR